MDKLDGECFEKLINHRQFDFIDAGPLYYPINKIKISRDKNLQLVLETEADINCKTNRQEYLPGTVRKNDSKVEINVLSHGKVTLNGVQPRSSREHFSSYSDERDYRTELSSVNELEITFDGKGEGTSLVEWIDNFDNRRFILPVLIKDEIETNYSKTFRTEDGDFKISTTNVSKKGSRSCIKCKVDNKEFYLVITNDDDKEVNASGYILYTSVPDKIVRSKIRNSISFVIGRPLIYLGHTIFTNEWSIVSTVARSAHTFNGRAFEIISLPPAPLSLQSENEIDEKLFEKSVDALFQSYDKFKLETIFWNYWYAVTASLPMAPAHWGALHESIINIATAQSKFHIKKKIIDDKGKWEDCRKPLLEVIEGLDLDPSDKKILINKISHNLNQLPQTEINKSFLKSINLEFSDFEMRVWKNRNNSAHGISPEPGNLNTLIREIKVLKILWHRIVLRLALVNDYYIDYYTLGFPIRPINQPMSEELTN